MTAGSILDKLRAPDIEEVSRGIRLFSGIKGQVNQILSGCIDDMVSGAIESLETELLIKDEPVQKIEPGFVLAGKMTVQSKRLSGIASLMTGPVTLHVFALTLGKRMDSFINQKMNDSVTEAFLADAAGAFIAEYLAEQLEKQIHRELGSLHLECTARFSPGYCDWGLADGQAAVSGFMDLSEIGVSLIPSSVLKPLKTLTGIMLSAERVPEKNPCSLCGDKGCRYRRKILKTYQAT